MRNIICLGGGTFDRTNHLSRIDRNEDILSYVRRVRSRSTLRVAYLPTARGDDQESMSNFRSNMSVWYGISRRDITVIRLFSDMPRPQIKRAILDADMIYVSGGNTASMLGAWREHGVDLFLMRAYRQGTVLIGFSAGALCWFSSGTSDAFGCIRKFDGCLSFIPQSYSPHGDNPRRVSLHRKLVAAGKLPDGIVHHDNDTLIFLN